MNVSLFFDFDELEFVYFPQSVILLLLVSASCGRVYHKECLKNWPQATWKDNFSGRLVRNGSAVSRNAVIPKETLLCPQHYCHTCISENPAVHKNRHCNEILVRCIRCPTAYHRRKLTRIPKSSGSEYWREYWFATLFAGVHCIPAGTEILTMSQIICPRHYEPPVGAKNVLHFNTSWCFICCIGEYRFRTSRFTDFGSQPVGVIVWFCKWRVLSQNATTKKH